MTNKIGVGIVGLGASRGWARASHLPALQCLAEHFEIRAISTTRLESARESAATLGGVLAFDNAHELASSSAVDLVVVAVNVVHHAEIARIAIGAGKMVYCEWPLGRNLAEAEELAELARQRGVRTVIGLQGRFAPALLYLRDLIADGHVGQVLASHIAGYAPDGLWTGILPPEWEATADPDSGNSLLAIPHGHAADMHAAVFGELQSVSATMLKTRKQAIRLRDNAVLPFPMHDQIAYSGPLANGAIATVRYQGGAGAADDFVWEIHGTEGILILSVERGYANIGPLTIRSVRDKGEAQTLTVPEAYRTAAPTLGSPADNVAALYRQLFRDLENGTSTAPDFDAALRRHQFLSAIELSQETGQHRALNAEARS